MSHHDVIDIASRRNTRPCESCGNPNRAVPACDACAPNLPPASDICKCGVTHE